MKTIHVSQLAKQVPMHALVMHQDTPLDELIKNFIADHSFRGVFLVDDEKRLVGVVNRHDMLNWARFQFNLQGRNEPLRLGQLRRLVSATRARDLAAPGSAESAVRSEDTLADALDKMARHDLVDIPVVDETGHIVDDLRLSEVLAFALQVEG
jgi:CBS domain-containing protein